MIRQFGILAALLLSLGSAAAADKTDAAEKAANSHGDEVKTLSGISVVGNNEAPKALYIVPWKSSELGTETDLSSNLLNDKLKPVDRDVFMRELRFYELSTSKQ